MKGSPLKTVNMAPLGDLFSLEQRCDNNSGFSDNDSRNATGKDSQLVKHTNQYHPPHGYGYPLSQQLFPSAPPLYQHSPFNVTHSSLQPTTSISQRFPSYGPLWQGYHLHHGSYGESQMFSQQLFPGEGPSSPGALRVPPGPPWNNTVNRPTSSSSTAPPGPPSGAPGRTPNSLQMKGFLQPAQPWKTDIVQIADLPPWPESPYDDYDPDD